MHALLVAIALVVASPEANFWNWFAAHKDAVAGIKTGREPIADELAKKLHEYAPELTFEVGSGMKPRELIISADGIVKSFPLVQKLVAAAPKVPGWKVFAFRQRKDLPSVQFSPNPQDKLSLSELAMKVVRPPQKGKKVDVAIFVRGRGEELDNPTKSGVYLLLDSLLGEYDTEMHLGEIDIRGVGELPKDARPMAELRGIVDGTK